MQCPRAWDSEWVKNTAFGFVKNCIRNCVIQALTNQIGSRRCKPATPATVERQGSASGGFGKSGLKEVLTSDIGAGVLGPTIL